MKRLATVTVAMVIGCTVSSADTGGSTDLILPTDPRFNVFELSNSAGDHTYASPHGTVLLSFATKDLRYCRVARIPADNAVVLACRNEHGWKIEATDSLAPGEAQNPTAFGGGYMRNVNAAVEALRATADFLDERGRIEAAAKGWRNPTPVDEGSLGPRDILRRTARVYTASESYVDTGTVQTVYTSSSRDRTAETRFKTAYIAPSDFRFESNMGDFVNVEIGYIVWSDQNSVKAWFSAKPDLVEDIKSVQAGLDAGAGISRDSSGMIPGLIFPGSKLGGDIVRLTSAVRLEDAQIDGFDCFQVQGFRWPNTGKPTTVWIDKESFLIRRVYEEQELTDVYTKTTWFYDPAVNVPVEPDALRFAKPGAVPAP